ncbi:hypothetical protein BJV78DRAFT_1391260 [Lactifluus subvellereus]|nr:hypothetical protein BJV78DRAFT_1391260 [Lactifluus subvellereus]
MFTIRSWLLPPGMPRHTWYHLLCCLVPTHSRHNILLLTDLRGSLTVSLFLDGPYLFGLRFITSRPSFSYVQYFYAGIVPSLRRLMHLFFYLQVATVLYTSCSLVGKIEICISVLI